MMLALVVLAQAAAVEPQIPELAAYMNCVSSEATRLLPSHESAEDIARAALFMCQLKFDPAVRAVDRASNEELRKRGFPGTGQIGPSETLKRDARQTAEDAAIAVVVNARLKDPVR